MAHIVLKAIRDGDEELIGEVKSVTDGTLVFVSIFEAHCSSSQLGSSPTQAGLFAAIVTAFLVETYPLSQGDADPPAYATKVNCLWFLSLILAVCCAFICITTQRGVVSYEIDLKKKVKAGNNKGLRRLCIRRFALAWTICGILTPILLSIVLFTVGLAILATSFNDTVSKTVIIPLPILLLISFFLSLFTLRTDIWIMGGGDDETEAERRPACAA
jgi:hypothetical protein